jgi:hypothetical protein
MRLQTVQPPNPDLLFKNIVHNIFLFDAIYYFETLNISPGELFGQNLDALVSARYISDGNIQYNVHPGNQSLVHVTGGRFNPVCGTYKLPLNEGWYEVSARWDDYNHVYRPYVVMTTSGGNERYEHRLVNYDSP